MCTTNCTLSVELVPFYVDKQDCNSNPVTAVAGALDKCGVCRGNDTCIDCMGDVNGCKHSCKHGKMHNCTAYSIFIP